MILDIIGHQVVHAELTKVGSALVEVLLFFSLTFSCKCGRKLCPRPHCSEEKAALKTRSVAKIPE